MRLRCLPTDEQRCCTKRNNDRHGRRELMFHWSSVGTTRRWQWRYRNFTYCRPPPTRAHSCTAHAKVSCAVPPWLAIATCVTAASAKLAPYRRRRHDLGQSGYTVGAERRRRRRRRRIEVPSAAGTLDILTVCRKVTADWARLTEPVSLVSAGFFFYLASSRLMETASFFNE